MKVIFGLLGLLFIMIFAILILQNNPSVFKNPFTKTPTATINKKTFSLLVAKKEKELEIGLSEKKSLPQDEGMLFVFEKTAYYSFWMKNMQFPIDIIFIKDNRVVNVYQDVQPPKSKDENLPIFKPEEPADRVLEINAGLSKKYGIKKGDEVKIENL